MRGVSGKAGFTPAVWVVSSRRLPIVTLGKGAGGETCFPRTSSRSATTTPKRPPPYPPRKGEGDPRSDVSPARLSCRFAEIRFDHAAVIAYLVRRPLGDLLAVVEDHDAA